MYSRAGQYGTNGPCYWELFLIHVLCSCRPKKCDQFFWPYRPAIIITFHECLNRLVDVLKTAARSVKKERHLPTVAVDLLEVSLREDSFDLFWNEIILNGLMKDQPGPSQ